MTLIEIIAIAVLFLAFSALLVFGGAYVYYMGTKRANPIPPLPLPRINPPVVVEPPVEALKLAHCPSCGKRAWKLSTDKQYWICTACPTGKLPGPDAAVPRS